MSTADPEKLIERAWSALSHERPGAAEETMGLFVVLRSPNGDARGSVGTTEPDRPLAELLPTLVQEAALHDPRHPPVGSSELADLGIELWLLPEPPRPVTDPGEIDPARDALRIRQGLFSGTLLPDVALACGWDGATTLAYACRKAGLTAGSWREPGTEVHAFRAVRIAPRPLE